MSGNRPLAEKDLTDFYESLVTRQRNYPPRVLERLGKIEEKFKNYLNSLATKDPTFIRRAQREFLERLNSLKKNEEYFYKNHFDTEAVERICHDIEAKKAKETISILDEVNLMNSFRTIYDEKTERSKEEKKEYKEAVEKLNFRTGISFQEQRQLGRLNVNPWVERHDQEAKVHLASKLVDDNINQKNYKAALNSYGEWLQELKNHQKVLQEIPVSLRAQAIHHPPYITFDEDLARTQMGTASCLYGMGDILLTIDPNNLDGALEKFRAAYEKQKTPPPTTPESKQNLAKYQFMIANTLHKIGNKYLLEGKLQQAQEKFTEAAELVKDSSLDFSLVDVSSLKQKLTASFKENLNLQVAKILKYNDLVNDSFKQQNHQKGLDACRMKLEALNDEYKLLERLPLSERSASFNEVLANNQAAKAVSLYTIGRYLLLVERPPQNLLHALEKFKEAYEAQKTLPLKTLESKRDLERYQLEMAGALYQLGKKYLSDENLQQAQSKFIEANDLLYDLKESLHFSAEIFSLRKKIAENLEQTNEFMQKSQPVWDDINYDDTSSSQNSDEQQSSTQYSSTAMIAQLGNMQTIAAPEPDLFQDAAPAEAPATLSYPTVDVELSQNMLECAEDICEMTENLLDDEQWNPQLRDHVQQYLDAFHPILMAEKKDGAAIQRGIAELQKVFEEIPESMRPERLGQLHQHFQSMLRPETPPLSPPQARR